MAQATDNRWPEVTDPRAREILGYVAALPGCNRSRRFIDELDYEYHYKYTGASITPEMLADSGFAATLLNNPDELPDISKGKYGLELWLSRIFRPRNMRQSVEDIAYNLPWYFRPEDSIKLSYAPGIVALNRYGPPALILLALLSGLLIRDWLFYLFYALFVMVISTSLFALRNYLRYISGLMDPMFSASLLYHYLLQEYSEPVEDPST